MNTPHFGHGFTLQDFYRRDGLVALDGRFIDTLQKNDVALFNQLMAARAIPDMLAAKAHSELLIALAPILEDFIADVFGITGELARLQQAHANLAPLYAVKRNFVQRIAAKKFSPEEAETFDPDAICATLPRELGSPVDELAFARQIAILTLNPETEAASAEMLTAYARYAAWALYSHAGKAQHKAGILFKLPRKLDPLHLVPVETESVDGVTRLKLSAAHYRRRDGFALTDHGTDLKGALDQANYCIWCHHQGRDSCSKGIKEKATGDKPAAFKKSQFGVTLAGCPLEEKISEMNLLKAAGHPIGALGVVVIDNPMTAGTGHRICNDCMKACIYQKQEPVDIPQVETRTLKDVLALPYGFEIYSLLTRWNPLNIHRPLPLPPSGRKVLVVGLGPSGFTLAHHLMNDGHTVIAIDGLKIEPLPPSLSGIDATGGRHDFCAVQDSAALQEPLERRVLAGFGGVAEYGITVRWDKNFLKIIRLLLERRDEFRLYGGVRFGGTLTPDQAFALGFDHIALCAGAGRPTVLDMPNGLARGVRQASDFLMALQLTGAAKTDSIANLQVRLPIVVIGGGLTAIDTATESLAYYIVQVEKFLDRFEALETANDQNVIRRGWSSEDAEISNEFLAHGRAVKSERNRAAAAGTRPDFIPLLQSWGGATIAYRRHLTDAPSYTLNHEEVEKALEEGITFVENWSPVAVEVDDYGAAKSLRLARGGDVDEIILPARTILVAAGTQPNTVLAREYPGEFAIDGKYFQAYSESGNKIAPQRLAKPDTAEMLMHFTGDGRSMSFFGDLHPSFAGNVVKAMASAKQGYPVVTRAIMAQPATMIEPQTLIASLDAGLRATVHQINRLTPTIVEIVVNAPFAARAFQPGQFYRLQNFETLAPRALGNGHTTTLAMEGLALTGAATDPERGLVSTIVLEMGGSSDLCTLLKPGEPIVLMGPTGTPTETPQDETVLLAGGGLGNAVLFSIGQTLREKGSRVVYFAGYRKLEDRYKIEQIEAAADIVIWCSDEAPGFIPSRPQDKTYVGNIVQAMLSYAEGALGEAEIALKECGRIIAIGSDRMMRAVAEARHGLLKPHLAMHHDAIGSINSPMQCMMKEICAQCLQKHRDPETGAETVVFSCYNQDQPLDRVDWASLHDRLSQNSLQEKMTKAWIKHCLTDLALGHA